MQISFILMYLTLSVHYLVSWILEAKWKPKGEESYFFSSNLNNQKEEECLRFNGYSNQNHPINSLTIGKKKAQKTQKTLHFCLMTSFKYKTYFDQLLF